MIGPIIVRYELPVYPGWRMWLWRIFHIKRPLWNVYEQQLGESDRWITGQVRVVAKHVHDPRNVN